MYANVQRGVSLPPLQSPLPASNLAAVRFPRLHLLASGRPGYGILPFPTSGPRPCGPDLARQLRLGELMPDQDPRLTFLCFQWRLICVFACLTWLVNCASAMLMPDTTPRLECMCCELKEELSGY